jgi:hypothetical protein
MSRRRVRLRRSNADESITTWERPVRIGLVLDVDMDTQRIVPQRKQRLTGIKR